MLKERADSFVCMSPEDANFLVGLGFNNKSVIGLDLPLFDPVLEPVKLGVFSRRYADGRKNEQWILNWARDHYNYRDGIYFSFIGSGWCPIAEELELNGWSVELLSLSGHLSSDYDIQLRGLRSFDAYLYMGFEGGGLGTYDAYQAGVPLFISKSGYHHGMPGVKKMFDGESEFREILSGFGSEWQNRKEFLKKRTMKIYAAQLIQHWSKLLPPLESDTFFSNSIKVSTEVPRQSEISMDQILKSYRVHQHKITVRRALGTAKRLLRKLV